MKCEKCGNEINDEDVFCQNCGWKIERENKVESKDNIDDRKINNSLSGHKKKKTKLIFAIASIFVVIIAVIVFFMLSTPKDVKIEAKTLAEEIYNGDVDKYNSTNLFVRGYIVRDTRNVNNEDDGYYMLVSDIENWETLDTSQMVVFQYEEGLKDDIGTGSEVVVQGRLKIQEDSPDMSILVGENIEVNEKVEPEEEYGLVGGVVDFNRNSDRIIDERVLIKGVWLPAVDGSDMYFIESLDGEVTTTPLAISDELKKTVGQIQKYAYVEVSGFTRNNGNYNEIEVESINYCNPTSESDKYWSNSFSISQEDVDSMLNYVDEFECIAISIDSDSNFNAKYRIIGTNAIVYLNDVDSKSLDFVKSQPLRVLMHVTNVENNISSSTIQAELLEMANIGE